MSEDLLVLDLRRQETNVRAQYGPDEGDRDEEVIQSTEIESGISRGIDDDDAHHPVHEENELAWGGGGGGS